MQRATCRANVAGEDNTGGHLVVQDSDMQASDSLFQDGASASGGAIWADDSTLDLFGCGFSGSIATPVKGAATAAPCGSKPAA